MLPLYGHRIWMFFFVAYCSASIPAKIWNYKSIQDISNEIDLIENTAISGVIESVTETLGAGSANISALNLMGVLLYRQRILAEASSYFERTCELDNFQTIEYIDNWLDTQRLIDPLSVVKPIQAALLRRREEDNSSLMQQLINAFFDSKRDNSSYFYLKAVLRETPQMYHLWVLFTDFHLSRYFMQQSNDRYEDADAPNTFHNDSALIFYGLTLFPRCPELLFLRSLHYLHDGNHICARYFGEQAAAVRHLDFGLLRRRYYDTLFEELANHTASVNTNTSAGVHSSPLELDTAEQECSPVFIRHTVEGYQSMYTKLSNIALPGADNLDRLQAKPPVGVLADSVFESRYQNEPERAIYLPSVQIGCNLYSRCVKPGFFIADAMVAVSTHFVTQAYDLSMLQSASFGLVYSSHTLEHLSHNNPPASTCATYPKSDRSVPGCYSEVDAALAEWRRVLALGGQLRLSVPDLSLLAQYFISPRSESGHRDMLSKMIYGGQVDQYDFHKAGFYFESLRELLLSHRFCNVTKVKDLGMFYDASIMNILISLSVFAIAC